MESVKGPGRMAVLGLFVVCAAAFATPDATPEVQSPYPPVRLAAKRPAACTFDRIMLSSGASAFVAWAGERRHILDVQVPPPFGNLVIGRFEAAGRSASPLKGYEGPDLVLPLRWEGPALWARATRNRMLRIAPDAGTVTEEGALPAGFDQIDVRATTHGDLSPLTDPAVRDVAAAVGTELVRANVTLGAQASVVGVRASDLGVVRIGERDMQTVARASYTRRLLAFPDAADFDAGVAYVGAPTRQREFLPYQAPLVDLATGRLAGTFNGAEIRLRGPAGPDLDPLRRMLAAGGAILDASFSGGSLAVLARLVDGTLAGVRLARGGVSRTDLCSGSSWPAATPVPRLSIFAIDASGRPAMRPGLPLAILYTRPAGPARDLVIVFDGGPTASLSDNYLWPQLSRLMGRDRDVLAVDYAGSVGGGLALTSRLTTRGMAAISEDVDAVLAWLSRQRYRRVYLDGGSFGAVPAMLALSRARQRFTAAIFTVPLLKLRDPTEWTQRRPFQTVSSSGQRGFEEAVFGGKAGRASFQNDLSRLVASTPFAARDLFVFGEYDRTSTASDLPRQTNSKVVTLRGGHHTTVIAREDYWRHVETVLEQNP